MMQEIGAQAQSASQILALASSEQKNHALLKAAQAIRSHKEEILDANKKDIAHAKERSLSPALIDRLLLDDARTENIAASIEAIAELNDPVGHVMDRWQRPNQLNISRIRVPLGVIGIIYESRPNVTVDAGILCLKSGNAVVLRCGSESKYSSRALHKALVEGLTSAELPEESIQLIPTQDREAVGELLRLQDYVDIIIPRGGKGLIKRVQEESRIPVIAHLDGICHIYLESSAVIDKAVEIIHNAKMRRTGICGAAETLLVERAALASHLPAVLDRLIASGCEIRGDSDVQKLNPKVLPASEEDWKTEYLEAVFSIKTVENTAQAIAHIARYGSHHTDCIITENTLHAEKFLNEVDSAIVMHNTSTQFADGGEFGMGAEIGISTGKMHARGPVGLEQLTSYKYQVRGNGQIRPL